MDTVGSLAIGYATGGNAGAFTGANADWNNRQLHSSEYKLAEQYANIVASRLNISKEEALGRIIRHMQRTVDYATAKADNFRTDDAIISILGANNLPKQDQHYTNPNYNKQYIQNYVRDFNLANKYNYFGKTPTQSRDYKVGVVTDIGKAALNSGIGIFESAANLATGEIDPNSWAYVHMGRIRYTHPEYGNALENTMTLGVAAVTAGRGVKSGNKVATNTVIDPSKFNYLFGNVSSNSHNAARSAQLLQTMQRLGVPNNTYGRNLLTKHFSNVTQNNNNIVRTFSTQYGNFEVRESLFAGPSGKFVKFETTYQVLPNGTRVFNTVIPKGGQ